MRKKFMRGTTGAIVLAGLAFAESGTYHAAPAATHAIRKCCRG